MQIISSFVFQKEGREEGRKRRKERRKEEKNSFQGHELVINITKEATQNEVKKSPVKNQEDVF